MMHIPVSTAARFHAHYTSAGLDKTGLTVTADIYRDSTLVSSGVSATEIADGMYQYTLASGSTGTAGRYWARFATSDTTVDVRHIVDEVFVGAVPANFTLLTINSNGYADANVVAWDGDEASIQVSGGNPIVGLASSTIGAAQFSDNAIAANTIAANALDDKGNWLKPTVAGRTLDVKDTGEAGLDFSNVFSGTTTDLALRSITLNHLTGTALSITAGPLRTAVSINGGSTGVSVAGGTQDVLITNDTITAGAASFTFTSLVALIAKFSGITSLANWLRAQIRKSNNDATAVSEINADNGTGTGTYDPEDDSQQALGDELAGRVSAGLAGLANLTSIGIVNGEVIECVKGDQYTLADGREWRFTKIAGEPWPDDLTGHTITFTANKATANSNSGDATVTMNGVIATATGDDQEVYFEPTEAFTDGLAIGVGNKGYEWDIVAIAGGVKKTLRLGVMTVRKNQTAVP